MKQLWKYLLIVVLFLIPGIITYCNADSESFSICFSESETTDCTLSKKIAASGQLCTAMMETFSAIRQVESLKIEASVTNRDHFKLINTFLGISHLLSPQEISMGNFIHLLSERYYQGFYIHFRKLII